MEVDSSSRTVSLLVSLNLQREQTQFCDCVVKLRHSPGRLHAAHRCVLAASSPVLSSIVSSSTCALVELESPSLSDSVLSLLLDYMYTGVVPLAHNQRSDLLSAAVYLQMEDLQESLNLDASKHPENEDYPDDVDAPDENAATRLRCRKYSRTFRDASVNTRSQVTPRGLVRGLAGAPVEVQEDRIPSAGTADEPEKTVGDETPRLLLPRRSTFDSSSSSSPPHPCVGAVPVIRHSKTMSPISRQPLSQTSTSRTSSQDGIVGNIHSKELNQHHRNDKDLVGWQSPGRRDDRKPDYSNPMDQDDGLSRISEENVHLDLRDSSVQRKSDLDLNKFASKRHRPDCCDLHDVWIHSQEVDSETGSEDGGRAKQEHSYSRCPAFNDDFYPNTESTQRGYNSDHFGPDPDPDSGGLSGFVSMNHDASEPPNLVPWYRGRIQYLHPSQGHHDHHVVSGPGRGPTGTPDRVLLLDISAKPAELLVLNDENAEDPNGCVGEPRPGPRVIRKVGSIGASPNTRDSWSDATTLKECSPPGEPDSGSSVLSVGTATAATAAKWPSHISARHPFRCSLCERSFSQRGSLNRHVRSHLGVRPFPCPRCPMTFSRQYRVTEHMRVHQRCVLQKPPASSI